MSDLHTERTFEAAIEYDLVTHRGYQARSHEQFDPELCLDPQRVLGFLQATQPVEWQKLTAIHQKDVRKQIEDDPELNQKKANQAIGRYLSLHPHHTAQKVAIIIEHFREVVSHKIRGKAKAMAVAGSREHALRYYRAFNSYLKEQGYTGIKALVAFSGSLQVDGQDYRETDLNGFSEKELPEQFAGEGYQVLIVAEKYQTGFDQPLEPQGDYGVSGITQASIKRSQKDDFEKLSRIIEVVNERFGTDFTEADQLCLRPDGRAALRRRDPAQASPGQQHGQLPPRLRRRLHGHPHRPHGQERGPLQPHHGRRTVRGVGERYADAECVS